jgi:hypothetical protein
VWICLFDPTHGCLESQADIGGDLSNIPPMAALGNLEPIVLGKRSGFVVSGKLGERGFSFFVVNIRDP